ncbi:histidinol-phosphate transaminase [Mesohalobacter halotolerans]|uniref:Histidinol-phosphate aminotransferase n=1 Tax=Mesohalobacter halotolerans TaxID=1883405 RepID=A0A4U5TS76_9FLAO|nr:histidinol-phosphate transaminase [Mesohalobacter halotolerans]MBS3739181.1 histidinol-phosphate transaminase [Psychroflexus sp.]TKS56264.1 histidinol-phosphate transaminase [Mesohalobacter halotolerans]
MTDNFDISKLIRPELLELKPYASARDEFSTSSKDITFLDANENPFQSHLNRYPDPYQTELKAEIAQFKNLSPKQILLGNGSDEVIDLLVRLFCQPYQDEILIFPPTYGMYQVVAELNTVKIKTVNLNADFQIDVSKTLNEISNQTKLIFICSPNNPTGNAMSRENVIQLLNQFKGIVVVDEAYQDFSNQTSMLENLNDFNNLVVMQTFSKAFGLAGARLGMCFANPDIIQYLNRIKPPYNVNQLTQDAARKQLKNTQDVQEQINILKEEKLKLKAALKNVDWVKKVYPSDANFLLVKVDNANKRYQMFIDHNIVVRNRHGQPGCLNCLRITVGTPKENAYLIKILNQFKL